MGTQEPDFGASSNLGGHVGGCTNTMRVDDIGAFEPRLDVHVEFYMCDNQGWSRHPEQPVILDMGFIRDDPLMCCEAYTAECMSCQQQMTVEHFCEMNPMVPGCPRPCCRAHNAECLSCAQGISVDDFCRLQLAPVPGCEHNPECIEDRDAFLSYVRSVAVNEANPKIREFISRIEMSGCDVVRHDHDAKFDWCTFHPEARRACSCVCEEVNQPKPVCPLEQMESWLHRDLSPECTDLFIAGLAEEHRSSCDCMRTIAESDAHEMFSSECYFHDWSERSFMQLWRDCN